MIIPEDGEQANSQLLSTVHEYLTERSIPPVTVSVITPGYVDIDVKAIVVIDNNYVEESIEYLVRQTIEEYFKTISGTVSSSIIPNELISYLSAIKGVSYVEEVTPKEVVVLGSRELPKLNNVEVVIKRRA